MSWRGGDAAHPHSESHVAAPGDARGTREDEGKPNVPRFLYQPTFPDSDQAHFEAYFEAHFEAHFEAYFEALMATGILARSATTATTRSC